YPSTEADDSNESLHIDGIMIDVEHMGADFNADITVDHPDLGQARLNGRISPDLRDFDISATLNQFDSGLFYPYLGVNIPELYDLGLITGNVRVNITDQSVRVLSGDIEAVDGKIIMPAVGILDFTDAASEFHYDKSVDRLLLNSLKINTAETSAISGQISLSGELREASTSTPVLKASLDGNNIPLQPVLDLMPDDSWLEHKEHGQIIRGGKIDHVQLDTIATINRGDDRIFFKTFALRSKVRNIKFIYGLGPVDRLSGILDGDFNFILGADGKIQRADTHLLLRESSILPTKGGMIIPLDGIEFIAKLDGYSLEIERLAMDALSYGQLAMRGKLTMDNQLYRSVLEAQLQAEALDNQMVLNLWPDALFPRTQSWLRKHVEGGQVSTFFLNIGLDLKAERIKPLFVEGQGVATASRFHYMSSHDPVTDAEFGLRFEGTNLAGTTFELIFNEGSLNGLGLEGSKLTINRQNGVADAALNILTRGDVAKIADILEEPGFMALSANGLSPQHMAGLADIVGTVRWQLPIQRRDLKPEDFDVKISASMEDAAMSGLPGGIALTEGLINLQYNNRDIRINGRGRLNEAPAQFYFHKDRQQNNVIDLTFMKSDALTTMINASFPLALGGAIGGQVYIANRPEMDELDINVNLDLGEAHFYIPRLELTKLEGERATVAANINIIDGMPREITNIVIDADVLRMEGDIQFSNNGIFKMADLNIMEWPGNVLSDVIFRRDMDNRFELTAEAEVIDLRPFRLKDSPGEGIDLTLDLSAKRLILDHRLSVAGSAMMAIRKDGSGEANFLGSMFLKDQPFMTEATMQARFGGNGDAMEASGLIGGVEASLNLQSGLADGDKLILTTQNAGQVLKALEVTDAIRGGQMTMDVLYEPDDAEHYVADFALTDFRVIEAPRAIRMLSVLSLAGLYSLVEGDGTAFTEGQARIIVTPDYQKLETVKARGDALAIELTGQINRDDESLNISGVIVPIYLFTELLGQVPLVGEIITGINKEGVFNTRFRMKGTIDDPDTDVRLSSIAPGLLRDIFAPDWINNERSRLIEEN
ncbi:MAG: AsmA-like C-terminal domain-containing protein, partial [Candidatus Puniceispirillales bacterium]